MLYYALHDTFICTLQKTSHSGPMSTPVKASKLIPIFKRHLYSPRLVAGISLNINCLVWSSNLGLELPSVATEVPSGVIHEIEGVSMKPSISSVVQFRILASPHPSADGCLDATVTVGGGNAIKFEVMKTLDNRTYQYQPHTLHVYHLLTWCKSCMLRNKLRI